MVALVWRRSWKRIRGRRLSVTCLSNRRDTNSGRSAAPSSRTNTRPVSCQPAPSARRSSAIRACQERNVATVSWSSATDRRLRRVFGSPIVGCPARRPVATPSRRSTPSQTRPAGHGARPSRSGSRHRRQASPPGRVPPDRAAVMPCDWAAKQSPPQPPTPPPTSQATRCGSSESALWNAMWTVTWLPSRPQYTSDQESCVLNLRAQPPLEEPATDLGADHDDNGKCHDYRTDGNHLWQELRSAGA